MAKGYGRKNATPHRGSVSKQLLLVLVCFLLGYLSASVFDFTSLSGWVNTQLLAQHSTQATKPIQEAQLPKPKFEFYTLLASERAQTNQQVATVSPAAVPHPVPVQIPSINVPMVKPPPAPSTLANAEVTKPLPPRAAPLAVTNMDGYLVQIGSFKSKQEAERIKASLTLKGFAVNIAMVNQQKVTWYRVVVGPFATRPQAEKIRMSIARSERIVGMVRKMNA